MDVCMLETMPGKAVEGGTSWSVECLYRPSPNVYTKRVLYSKSDWLAYGYLTVGIEEPQFESFYTVPSWNTEQ